MVPDLHLLSYLLLEKDEAWENKTSQGWLYQGPQAMEDLLRDGQQQISERSFIYMAFPEREKQRRVLICARIRQRESFHSFTP